MRLLLGAERYKLRKNGTFRLICASMAGMAVFFPAIIYWTKASQEGVRITLTVMELYANAMMINQLMLQIALGILAGFYIASDYRAGVLKRMMSIGAERSEVYLAKLATYTAAVAASSLILPILAASVGSVMQEAGLMSGYGQHDGVTMAQYMLRTIGYTLLYAAAFASIAAWFAVATADSGRTIGLSLLFFLFADQILAGLSRTFPDIAQLYEYSLFKLFRDALAFRMEQGDWAWTTAMPIMTFAAFAMLGMYAVRRQEIH